LPHDEHIGGSSVNSTTTPSLGTSFSK